MGKKEKTIEIQIPAEDSKEIKELVKKGVFASNQEFIMYAVKRYFEEAEKK